MYRWEIAPEAQASFDDLPADAHKALTNFMDAVVAADPMEFQRDRSGRDNVLRTLPFGPNGEGIVVFLVWFRDDLAMVVQITWEVP